MLNASGGGNVANGYFALSNNSAGSYNTAMGNASLSNNTTGNNNIAIGQSAAINVSGSNSNNIHIGSDGLNGDSFTIRIGTSQTSAYIAGIYGAASSSGIPVYINSNGQLGTQTSSLRFKEQVRDMGDRTSALMKLRPVTFLYKPEYDKGERTLQYGLIAEEVAKVYPELVAYDKGGQPYTVRYQYITTMLLNEVQKQYYRDAAQGELIKAQGKKIDELEQRLSRIERLIPQTVAQK